MGIELHEGQRPMDRSGGPEFGQRYGVVAAKDYRGHPGAVDRPQALLYPPVALLDVARDDGCVAVVYDREVFEDRHVQARVVAPEEVGGAAYPLRAEAGPGPEGGAVSNGAPTIASSAFARSRVFGRRMKVRTSEKRGVSNESAGS